MTQLKKLYREITIEEVGGQIVYKNNIDKTRKLKGEKVVDKRIKTEKKKK